MAIFGSRRAFKPPDVDARMPEDVASGLPHVGYIARSGRAQIAHSNGDRLRLCGDRGQDHERHNDPAWRPKYDAARALSHARDDDRVPAEKRGTTCAL